MMRWRRINYGVSKEDQLESLQWWRRRCGCCAAAEEKLLWYKVIEDGGGRQVGMCSFCFLVGGRQIIESYLESYLVKSCPKPRGFFSFWGRGVWVGFKVRLGLGSFFGVSWSS
jgi:hypothetical protein